YFNLANLYQTQQIWDKALCYLDSSLIIAEKTRDFGDLIEIYSAYSGIYKENKNFEKALAFQVLMDASKDTMLVRNKDKLIIEMATKYDTEKKEKENEILRLKDEANQAFILTSAIAALILILLLLFIYFLFLKIKKKADAAILKQTTLMSEQKQFIEKNVAN
ncbi:MAG: hypothetical protein ACK452_12920, partial [Bacteroidota bacterium]